MLLVKPIQPVKYVHVNCLIAELLFSVFRYFLQPLKSDTEAQTQGQPLIAETMKSFFAFDK